MMTKRCLSLTLLSITLCVVTGCGPRKYTVNLNPNHFQDQYVTENAISSDTPSLKFARGTFTDSRENTELFGESKAFHILTDNPFDDAFYDGIQAFLGLSHHTWVEPSESDVKIDVELLKTDSELIPGFWVIQFMSEVSTKLTFIDTATGNTIYTGSYEGLRRLRTPAGHESMFKKVVNESIVDCINHVGMDQALHDAFVEAYQK